MKKILVTGANGFLGRHIVARLRAGGYAVRALVRPTSAIPAWDGAVESVAADLRTYDRLGSLFDGVDALVHLAAGVAIDEDSMFASTVAGTERLLEAMARSPVRRLVFASSFVVYDWSHAEGTLDEGTPLAGLEIYGRGPYDVSKLWQERVVVRMTAAHHFELTVLRPGFIWGKGRAAIAGMGRIVGPLHLLIGPTTRLPLTHVENCADCFVRALESPAAIGQVFNVVDGDDVRVWRYMHEYARGTGHRGVAVPVPYRVALGVARLASATSHLLFGRHGRLPSILTPQRFEAQFKPLRFSNQKLREVLGWEVPLDFEECVARTYEPPAPRRSRRALPVRSGSAASHHAETRAAGHA